MKTRQRHIRAGATEAIEENDSMFSMDIRREIKWVSRDSAGLHMSISTLITNVS